MFGIDDIISVGGGAAYAEATSVTVTTVANKVTYVGMIYSNTSTRWEVVAVTTQA